jgi:dihydroflavonol-4-reductase
MILVTGGTGFLGSYIIQQLVEQGYNVRAIKRNSSRLPFYISADILDKVEWVEGDVLDVFSLDDAMKGIDIVIHAAAIVSFHQSDKSLMTQTNIDGTANVVNMALENNIRRFIHISSVAALGRTKNGEIVTEKKEWTENNINTSYAISKHKAEMEVWRGIGEGMDGVILNPSTILGFGDWNHSSCAIFKTGYNEFGYYTEGVNGFVDVTDVAKAAVLLMQSNISAERFIISSENWSFKKLLDCIADGFQKKKPQTLATPFIAAIAWRMEKIKALLKNGRPMLTQESAKVAQSKTFFDNSKILAALPHFKFSDLEKTITESCAKYTNVAYTTR